MRFSTISALVLAPLLAVACAAPTEEDASANDEALKASLGFNAAVGAIEYQGKRVCTATYVDVDAKVGGQKVEQVLMSGACVGALDTASGGTYIGGAAFVSGKGSSRVRVPLLSVTEKHGAEAGLAAGILARKVPGVAPISADTSLSTGASIEVAIFEPNANGELIRVGAKASGKGQAALDLATSCVGLKGKSETGAASAFSTSLGSKEATGVAVPAPGRTSK